jgi:hypothetical protein
MWRLVFVAGCAALMGAPLPAATILGSSSANFSKPVGGNGAFYRYADTDGLAGNEEIRWGQPATNGPPTSANQSGLRFVSAAAQAIVQGAQFTLGTLTYYNNPVYDAVSAVDLGIGAGLVVDGTPLFAGPFTFGITVDETPNETFPALCPYPSTVGCSDKIAITTGGASQVFTLGNQTLTLFIDGFIGDGGGLQSAFIAQEQENTSATLVGHFDLASAVPEPASWAMMVLGFGLLGGAMRRSRGPVWRKRVPLPGVIVG